MAAFRFLALLTVGFVLLMFVFLHLASQGRLEREAERVLTGPSFIVEDGGGGSWTIDLGAPRIEQAWPGAQRQPRLFLKGAAGAQVSARAVYLGMDDAVLLDALVGGEHVIGLAGDVPGELEFGPLWLSWEHPLRVTFAVIEAGAEPVDVTPVLRGEPSSNYITARKIARGLWTIFTVIGVLGFAGLIATQKKLFGAPIGGPRPADDAS